MQMPWAVLLLHFKDQNAEPFTREFAERYFTNAGVGTGNVVDYYREVSHGRADIGDSKVFGWHTLNHSMVELTQYTAQEQAEFDSWTQAKRDEQKDYVGRRRRDKMIAWGEELAADQGIKLSDYVATLLVYSDNVDYFGRYQRVVVQFNRANLTQFSLDMTGVSHEMGHGFGFKHSRRDGTLDDYADKWDIMSAYTVQSADGSLIPSGVDPDYRRVGPGLNAVHMDLMGWLDETRVWKGFSGTVTLRPLHRLDLPGYIAAKIGSQYAEFRVKERWDNGIEGAGVFLHHVGADPGDGTLCSYLTPGRNPAGVMVQRLVFGDSWQRGSPTDLARDFMHVLVTRIDPGAREAELEINVRLAQKPLMELAQILVGGVAEDGGGAVFSPTKGLLKVPPRSPLSHLVDDLAELLAVDELTIPLPERNRLSDRTLARIHDRVGRMIRARSGYSVPERDRGHDETS